MAAVAVERAMNINNNPNPVHPFFGQKKKQELRANNVPTSDTEGQASIHDSDEEVETAPKKRGRRGKKHDAAGQKTIFQGFGIKPEVKDTVSDNSSDVRNEPQAELEVDPNHERRKRRKTASPEHDAALANGKAASTIVIPDSEDGPVEVDMQHPAEAAMGDHIDIVQETPKKTRITPVKTSGENHLSDQVGKATRDISIQTTPTRAKPARTMKLKGGKLASPTAPTQDSPKTPKRGKRGKNAALPSLIVKVDYGSRSSDPKTMGARIQGILDGEMVHKLPAPTTSAITQPPTKPQGPPKVTHPFFSGKPMKPEAQETTKSDAPKQSPRKASTTTPGKLRAARDAFRNPGSPAIQRPVFTKRKKPSHLGEYPAWPDRESAHVRGIDDVLQHEVIDLLEHGFPEKSAKRRVDVNVFDDGDSVLKLSATLPASQTSCLRHPKKIITTGAGLQDMIAPKLSVSKKDKDTHPAVVNMYRSISTSLSAFDRYECEPQAWTQKYTPSCAAEVLQAGREAHVLNDWLQRSTITAVQTSSKRSTASSTLSALKTKKKRKRKEEDDWLVDSDEEVDDLSELLPLTDATRPVGALRSVVRGGDDYEKAKPATSILLSGPHGSGKTAAVYAVAKELGFEVFEINSASRRSGRDILDKIGDMTENHLVQQVSKALAEDKPANINGKVEAIKIDEPDAPDPKQKSMASFFRSAPYAKKPANTTNTLQKMVTKPKDEPKLKGASKQKQSLILLEEVDVLFEEDKNFWMTVLTLAEHSKRPIVMTCNDERFIPQALSFHAFHAMLRFAPPPADLATDYLLLLAAREGHILQREAVNSLYATKGHDLRGAITELNFWCQIAVGDPTKGFNWMIERYPPGIDVDAQGRTLRTASENTFVAGMNAVRLGNKTEGCSEYVVEQENWWSQAWDDWEAQPIDAHATNNNGEDKLSTSLDDITAALDMLSAGDLSFGLGMRNHCHQRLDCTSPALREKAIASYSLETSFRPDVLQADPISDYTSMDKDMAVASQLSALKLLYDLDSEDYLCRSTGSARDDILDTVETKCTQADVHLTRKDFFVLDPLATDPDSETLSISSFDREFRVITSDLAPYARTIAREFQLREEERLRMSNLISAGGRRRQTRNAFAAMDGGRRGDRRARYFELWKKMGIDAEMVLETGGEGWASEAVRDDAESRTGTGTISGMDGVDESPRGTQESEKDELHGE